MILDFYRQRREACSRNTISSTIMVMKASTLGGQIRARRMALGLTQADLAQLAGCSLPSVVAASADKPTLRLDILSRIATVVGFKVALIEAGGA